MDEQLFDELVESVKETVAISKGKKEPGRIFNVKLADVKAIREKADLSQKTSLP